MTSPSYVLFDNSALNHLFGQSPAIGEAARAATDRLARDVANGALSVMVNVALRAEMAGTYFSNEEPVYRSSWKV